MTAQGSLFSLAREISEAHLRSAERSITVIPVIVDDLRVARPVLRALAEVHEGLFLDTSETVPSDSVHNLSSPVPGTDDRVRRRAVEKALQTPSGQQVTILDTAAGLVDATLGDPSPAPSLNPGERTILAFARAAIHSELEQHSFVIIAYDGEALDVEFRRAAWDLMADQFPNMPSSTLRTLVVVTASPIDIPLHCQPNKGFSYAVERGRLLRRQGRDDLQAAVAQFVDHEDPTVLFLAAGFAASSRLPLGNFVRDGAIRRLLRIQDDDSLSTTDLAKRFYSWIAAKPGWMSAQEQSMPPEDFATGLTLERVINAEKRLHSDLPTLREFKEHHDSVMGTPGPAVIGLAKVLEHCVGKAIVVEVNFDRLLEEHVRAGLKVFASEAEFEGAADYISDYISGEATDIPVLKLHGTIEDFDSCIVSLDQTELGLGEGKLEALRALLGTPSAPRRWYYIGASMRDHDLLRVLGGEDFARRLDERWVLPYLVESVDDYAKSRTAFWSRTELPRIEDRLITETSDSFFGALADAYQSPQDVEER